MRESMAQFEQYHRLPAAAAAAVQLVCEEWFLNIVQHGYAEGVDSEAYEAAIQFEMTKVIPNEIRISFIDSAPPFNPLEHPTPDTNLPVHKRDIGGLGIHLIRTSMDACDYVRLDGRNHFTMVKRYNTDNAIE